MKTDKILFIRKDHIGDIICTTPALAAVRRRFPHSKVGLFINSYAAETFHELPDVDEVYVFRKGSHYPAESAYSLWRENLRLIRQVRAERYDVSVSCGLYSPTLARFSLALGARERIGYINGTSGRPYYSCPMVQNGAAGHHEVERTYSLLSPLGVDSSPGSLFISVEPRERERFETFLHARRAQLKPAPLVAVVISARKKANRWPLEKFASLIGELAASANVLLLWSPGKGNSPKCPGDDEGAASLIARFGEDLFAYPTLGVKATVAALEGADMVVTLDTGTLHISAALGKPTVALMTRFKAAIWQPWHTPCTVVTAEKDVETIEVSEVLEAVRGFLQDPSFEGAMTSRADFAAGLRRTLR